MSSTSRLVAPAFNKILSLRRLSSSSSSSPFDHTAPSAVALLSSLVLQEHTPSSAALSLIRAQPSLADELYALIAVSGKSDAPLTPGSLAILHSLAACHRIPPSSASLLSQLLARFSSPDDATSFLRDSLAAGAPAPDVYAFNSLLTALGRAGDLRGMTELFTSMRGASVQPNVVTYGILLNGLCKAGRVGEALKVLGGMSRPGSDVRPDIVILNTVVDGLCKTGRLQEAIMFVDERMRRVHVCAPNTVTYNCLADAFCRVGDVGMACEVVGRMEKEGVPPNVVTMNTIVGGLCRVGRVGAALEFFREKRTAWPETKGNAMTYSTLVSAFLHCNNVGMAMELFHEMADQGHPPDAIMYFTMISGLTQARRLEDACTMASSMKKAGFKLDAKAYNILIGGFCRKKRLREAYELLAEMKGAGLQPDGLQDKNMPEKAFELMDQMRDERCTPDYVTLDILMEWLPGIGETERLKPFMQQWDLKDNHGGDKAPFLGARREVKGAAGGRYLRSRAATTRDGETGTRGTSRC
ncbi:hypothetical protein C2845_PM10G06700 [Panicum miliaceum]|uniref:Pentatricopeptide repeat-containing protein n=1 Tax=Panicum miliaceum TaxID=4540 RepID=A0A3L6PEP4_PANMI|nr:hypothetical protein C2845_PM10G06700 [Panicum miliaceum]